MARYSLIAGLGLALAALAVGFAVQTGTAGGKLDPVKVAASAGKPGDDGQTTVTVKLTIDKNWHIYANPVEFEDLAPAQTTVTVKSAGKKVAAKVKYPEGVLHNEKGVGKFKVYEGNITIEAKVPSTAALLEVSVLFQACDAKQCLLPKTVKIKLP